MGRLWATFEACFLSFHWQKMNSIVFWKYFRVHSEKLHRIKVNKSRKNFGKHFLWGKNQFFRAKNLSVNTWRLGPDIYSLICGQSCLSNVNEFVQGYIKKVIQGPKSPQTILWLKFPSRMVWTESKRLSNDLSLLR